MTAEFSTGGGSGDGVAFLVSAGIAYEIIAACCSSPQTTEINASTRADTLMKWVNLGVIQAAVFIGIAAYVDAQHRNAIIAGGLVAIGLLYVQYVHAKRCGLAKPGPSTETTGSGTWGMRWAA